MLKIRVDLFLTIKIHRAAIPQLRTQNLPVPVPPVARQTQVQAELKIPRAAILRYLTSCGQSGNFFKNTAF